MCSLGLYDSFVNCITAQFRSNTVDFFQNTHNRHAWLAYKGEIFIARPRGRLLLLNFKSGHPDPYWKVSQMTRGEVGTQNQTDALVTHNYISCCFFRSLPCSLRPWIWRSLNMYLLTVELAALKMISICYLWYWMQGRNNVKYFEFKV